MGKPAKKFLRRSKKFNRDFHYAARWLAVCSNYVSVWKCRMAILPQKKRIKKIRKWWRKTRRFVDEADMITRSRIKGMLHQFSSNFMAIFQSLAKSCHGGRKRLEGSSYLRIYQPLLSTRELAKQGKNSYRFLSGEIPNVLENWTKLNLLKIFPKIVYI